MGKSGDLSDEKLKIEGLWVLLDNSSTQTFNVEMESRQFVFDLISSDYITKVE